MNIDPIHWAALGLGGALFLTVAVGGTAYWKQGKELQVCNAEYAGFREKTRAEGLASEILAKGKETELAFAAVNIQGDLNDAHSRLNRLHADYQRLRIADKARTSGERISSLSDAAGRINCPDARAEFAKRLERLEVGIHERILRSRDEAIDRTIACKKYVDRITEIMNRGNR